MANRLVHDMDTPWTPTNPALLQVGLDSQTSGGAGTASNRLTALTGATGARAEFLPAVPLNLAAYSELRLWVRATMRADGSPARPFALEFSYLDAADAPGEEHRWFVPVNEPGTWEQRRIGIETDRRGAITRFRFTCLTDRPFVCLVDELLAVRDEMLADAEAALVERLDGQVTLPGLSDLLLSQTAAAGAAAIVLPLAPGFAAGNRVLIQGGSAGDETHTVAAVVDDAVAATTTLQFAPGDLTVGTLTAGVATVSLTVPAMVEAPPLPPPAVSPAIILTHLDAREDPQRAGFPLQRDSFRPRGVVMVCSVRPAARPYLLEYQLVAHAPDRAQQVRVHTLMLERLSMDIPLRINGYPSPIWILPPPAVNDRRRLGMPAPVYIRVGARMEVSPRREQTWVRRAQVDAAPIDAPDDREGIVLRL